MNETVLEALSTNTGCEHLALILVSRLRVIPNTGTGPRHAVYTRKEHMQRQSSKECGPRWSCVVQVPHAMLA